jgi:2-polyprenyl-3-methyl-5-hydroxy-6-metoxy-1,4-benzoquinol methylase
VYYRTFFVERLSEDSIQESEKMSMNEMWIERGKDYLVKFNKKSFIQKARYWIQEQVIIGALDRVQKIKKIDTILDAGCGFGRITKILCEFFPYAEILGVDISPDQLREARRVLPRVTFWTVDLTSSLMRTVSDLVVCVEVLMHIDPDNILKAVASLTRGEPEFIVIVDWDSTSHEDIRLADLAGFCWIHNYGKMFSDAGYYRLKEKKIPFVDQKLRIFRRRSNDE